MDKDDILTDEAYGAYNIYSEIVRYIEEYRAGNNLRPEQMNILDWGCARGEMVLRLREQGYSAYGVEIEPKFIANSRDFFRSRGYDSDALLQVVKGAAATTFPDGFFHVIVSNQVLEHIGDLKSVAREMCRLSVGGGISFHWLPPKWCILEPHYFIPFVHWLPRNSIRKYAIFLFVLTGLYARHWKEELSGCSVTEITEAIYSYSVKFTHYRSSSELAETFRQAGLSPRFVTIDNPRLWRSPLLSALLRIRIFNKIADALLVNFVHAEFYTSKSAPSRSAGGAAA